MIETEHVGAAVVRRWLCARTARNSHHVRHGHFLGKRESGQRPVKGYALWSDAANWDPGLPVNGGAVDVFATGGDDDLAALSLLFLDLADASGGPPL